MKHLTRHEPRPVGRRPGPRRRPVPTITLCTECPTEVGAAAAQQSHIYAGRVLCEDHWTEWRDAHPFAGPFSATRQ